MFRAKRSLFFIAVLAITAASVAQAIEVPVVWFEEDFENPEGATGTRLRSFPNWIGGSGPENRIQDFGGDRAVRLKGRSGTGKTSDAGNAVNWVAQSAGNFQILRFTLQSQLDQQSNVGNHLYITLNDSSGNEMGTWYGWSHNLSPRVANEIPLPPYKPVSITDGAVHEFAITYDPTAGTMEWWHDDVWQWSKDIGAGKASERVWVEDKSRDANDYVWLDDIVVGTVLPEMVWDGGADKWAADNWNDGQFPKTGMDMIIDDGAGDSDVTVDADFNSALSLSIGETNTAVVRVNPGVTLTVDNQVTVGAKGTIGGGGTIVGSLVVAGTVSPGPGNSVGTITVEGNLAMAAGPSYDFEVDLDGADVISDLIDVNGVLTLPSGDTPADTITINISDLSAGGVGAIADGELTLFTFDEFGNEPSRIADLVSNGVVDDADLNFLLSTLGDAGGPADIAPEGAPDGIVDQADLDRLLEDFGWTFGGGPLGDVIIIGDVPAGWVSAGKPTYQGTRVFLSGVDTGAGLAAVPEPGTTVLLLLGVLGILPMLRRRMRG